MSVDLFIMGIHIAGPYIENGDPYIHVDRKAVGRFRRGPPSQFPFWPQLHYGTLLTSPAHKLEIS